MSTHPLQTHSASNMKHLKDKQVFETFRIIVRALIKTLNRKRYLSFALPTTHKTMLRSVARHTGPHTHTLTYTYRADFPFRWLCQASTNRIGIFPGKHQGSWMSGDTPGVDTYSVKAISFYIYIYIYFMDQTTFSSGIRWSPYHDNLHTKYLQNKIFGKLRHKAELDVWACYSASSGCMFNIEKRVLGFICWPTIEQWGIISSMDGGLT